MTSAPRDTGRRLNLSCALTAIFACWLALAAMFAGAASAQGIEVRIENAGVAFEGDAGLADVDALRVRGAGNDAGEGAQPDRQ